MMCGAYVASNVLSKLCLNYVSVPTMIVVKSCKLVCVMAGSKLITGRLYSWFEYGIAIGLVSGMISFSLADMKGPMPSLDKDAMELFGLGLLLLALCCDSVLGNLQEKVQKSKVSPLACFFFCCCCCLPECLRADGVKIDIHRFATSFRLCFCSLSPLLLCCSSGRHSPAN